MPTDKSHEMIPDPTHDEDARQAFVLSFREWLVDDIGPGVYKAYDARAESAFTAAHGRAPEIEAEAGQAIRKDPYYQLWSAMQRNSQQMMWSSAADTVERTIGELNRKFSEEPKLGSLRLDPELEIPRYHTLNDIHQMPGGYHTEYGPDDLGLGAVYDVGVPIYSMNKFGKHNDLLGGSLARYFRDEIGASGPLKILDLGCTIGSSTVPWKQAFPDAEVHGVDVAAPVLRWGHARASSMGYAIEFSQQNAESMDFEDDSFDVVSSAILFHETSRSALPRILKECHRVLKPGGMMLHLDAFATPENQQFSPIQRYIAKWEVENNNEYFILGLSKIDIIKEARAAGFDDPDLRIQYIPLNVDALEQGKPKEERGYMQTFGRSPVLIATKRNH